jgi:hypothetical protein
MIFEKLNKMKLCYSVVVAVSKLRALSNDSNQKEYFILAHKRDAKRLKDLSFFKSETYQTIERNLSEGEVDQFKAMSDSFNKIHSGNDGRVYELKGNGFKRYYNLHKKITNLN